MKPETKATCDAIEALPKNGRILVDAGGRGLIETALTTAKLQAADAALQGDEGGSDE